MNAQPPGAATWLSCRQTVEVGWARSGPRRATQPEGAPLARRQFRELRVTRSSAGGTQVGLPGTIMPTRSSDIVGLQISVDDAFLVRCVESIQNLRAYST